LRRVAPFIDLGMSCRRFLEESNLSNDVHFHLLVIFGNSLILFCEMSSETMLRFKNNDAGRYSSWFELTSIRFNLRTQKSCIISRFKMVWKVYELYIMLNVMLNIKKGTCKITQGIIF